MSKDYDKFRKSASVVEEVAGGKKVRKTRARFMEVDSYFGGSALMDVRRVFSERTDGCRYHGMSLWFTRFNRIDCEHKNYNLCLQYKDRTLSQVLTTLNVF